MTSPSIRHPKSAELWQAATEGNLRFVQLLCQDPAVNVNWEDEEFSRTPFYRACGHDRAEVVKFMLGLPGLLVNRPNRDGATPFYIACQQGKVDVLSLLLTDQRVDVTTPRDMGATPFSNACENGHVDVVSLLLSDPRIDVNFPRERESTPFFMACQNGHLGVISLLLSDPRIDTERPMEGDMSPLWIASSKGHVEVVQHLLASGRVTDTQKLSTFNNKTAEEEARANGSRTEKYEDESDEDHQKSQGNGPMIADLIAAFERDPEAIRARLRRDLGILDSLAGELFALVVYLSDGYLEFPVLEAGAKTPRFFNMAAGLPLDLQMVLCNRAFGLADSIVKRRCSERGFRKFGKRR